MNTIYSRGKLLIGLALTLGAMLFALSAPAAHAGPGGGPGSENPGLQPLQVHASENPVVFQPLQTTKTITFTWGSVPNMAVAVRVFENGKFLWIKQEPPGSSGPLDLTVIIGSTYTIQLMTPTYQIGPELTITTKRSHSDSTIIPQPPAIDSTIPGGVFG